jgi:hypothetical protein
MLKSCMEHYLTGKDLIDFDGTAVLFWQNFWWHIWGNQAVSRWCRVQFHLSMFQCLWICCCKTCDFRHPHRKFKLNDHGSWGPVLVTKTRNNEDPFKSCVLIRTPCIKKCHWWLVWSVVSEMVSLNQHRRDVIYCHYLCLGLACYFEYLLGQVWSLSVEMRKVPIHLINGELENFTEKIMITEEERK